MATGLLDLFPEAQDNVEKGLNLMKIQTSFPLPEFIVVFGFLFVVVLEQASVKNANINL